MTHHQLWWLVLSLLHIGLADNIYGLDVVIDGVLDTAVFDRGTNAPVFSAARGLGSAAAAYVGTAVAAARAELRAGDALSAARAIGNCCDGGCELVVAPIMAVTGVVAASGRVDINRDGLEPAVLGACLDHFMEPDRCALLRRVARTALTTAPARAPCSRKNERTRPSSPTRVLADVNGAADDGALALWTLANATLVRARGAVVVSERSLRLGSSENSPIQPNLVEHVAAYDRDRRLVPTTFRIEAKTHVEHWFDGAPRPELPIKRIPGEVFLLHAGASTRNWHHALVEMLPTLACFARMRALRPEARVAVARVRSDDASDVVCHGEKCIRDLGTDAAIEAVSMLYGADAVLELADDGLYAVPLLGTCGFPRVWGAVAPDTARVLGALRASAMNASRAAPSAGRRVYVAREGPGDAAFEDLTDGARRATNDRETTAALAARGFVRATLAGLSMAKKAAVLRDAEVVVAPYGAGLLNAVFAGGTLKRVLSLGAPSFGSLEHHAAVVGAGRAFPPVVEALDVVVGGDVGHSFTVDVDALVAALETRGLGTAASCDVSDATLD